VNVTRKPFLLSTTTVASTSLGHKSVPTPACTNGVWPPLRLRVWRRRTNRRPCRPTMSNPSTSPWDARPAVLDDETIDWLRNACPEIYCGPAVYSNNWLKRRRRSHKNGENKSITVYFTGNLVSRLSLKNGNSLSFQNFVQTTTN